MNGQTFYKTPHRYPVSLGFLPLPSGNFVLKTSHLGRLFGINHFLHLQHGSFQFSLCREQGTHGFQCFLGVPL